MKNIIANLFSTIFLALVLSTFLPWWSVITAALITSLTFPLHKFNCFFIPFISGFLFSIIHSYNFSDSDQFAILTETINVYSNSNSENITFITLAVIIGIFTGTTGIIAKVITSKPTRIKY